MNEHIENAVLAINSGDSALIGWARRNIECSLEEMGYVLLRERRIIVRNNPRRAERVADAVQWEAKNRNDYLMQIDAMAQMLDQIDEIEDAE
jgi:hypothetical protein